MSAEEKIIAIEHVEHVGDYKLALTFNDGKKQVVDFYPFLSEAQHPDTRKYLDHKEFAKFNLDYGFLEWNDWELCFPMDKLYNNTIKPKFSE